MMNRNDETTILPPVQMHEETEAEQIASAKARGITLGAVVVTVAVAICMVGTAFGAFIVGIFLR